MTFDPGERYHRERDLASHGGVWQQGIITARDSPYVCLVYSERGEEFGYEDEFREDGTFVYTGMGGSGDMEWRFENRAIRDHRELGKELHLFEKAEESYMVTHVGRFEHDHCFTQELPDRSGELREAFRFVPSPAGGTDVALSFDPSHADASSLYDAAAATVDDTAEGSSATAEHDPVTRRSRSEVVKAFARQAADGVCLGCEERAPFVGDDGDPYLEVHHLRRVADGGPDKPENVVAICPNCHREVHHGRNGAALNEELKARAAEKYQRFGE